MNPEYGDNPDLKYKVKGKHGLSRKAISPGGPKAPAIKMNYPAVAKKSGFKFIRPKV